MENILITGASSGIGREFARVAARLGYNLILHARDLESLERLANELENNHHVFTTSIAVDLSQDGGPEKLFTEVSARNLPVGILINNAGQGQRGEFEKITLERHLELIQINIIATVKLTHLFLPEMIERKRGKIMNMSCMSGFEPAPLQAVYHATKSFLILFSEALAEELKSSGVTVTCYCPGATSTDFFHKGGMMETNLAGEVAFMSDPKEIAQQGIEAMIEGERTYIPGIANKIITFTRRIMPLKTQAKTQKKSYELSEELINGL